ncbi:signal peptidase II [Nocardioides sp. 31GB23]|uniref:signal peptidase II n=1 Tax=Nocardioides sp. 31GB23 TaxID=3156065 RepID=UPI0032AFD1AC
MTSGTSPAAARARRSRAVVVLVALTAASIDLVAKAVSEARLADSTVDLGLLQLRLGYNSGVAFSMGDKLPVGVIVAITTVISIALAAYVWHRAPRAGWVERIAGGAVLGGAVANVIDRARDGVVTDYLHTGWWPTFNLADTFLVTGFIVIAVLQARPERTVAEDGKSTAAHPANTDAGDF